MPLPVPEHHELFDAMPPKQDPLNKEQWLHRAIVYYEDGEVQMREAWQHASNNRADFHRHRAELLFAKSSAAAAIASAME